MRQTTVGNTGLKASVLSLGTMYFGIKVSEKDSFLLLDEYLAEGGDLIDTANKYATWIPGFEEPVGELLIGKWLRMRNNRSRVKIATKMGFPYLDVPMGLTPKLIEQEVNASLARLGVDYIDLLYAHTDDYSTPQEVYMEAFDRLVRQGKVCHLGASNFFAYRLAAAQRAGNTPFCCVQTRLSLLWPMESADFGRQVPASFELTKLCEEEDVRLLCYSPLLSGIYSRDDRDMPPQYDYPRNHQVLKDIRNLAAGLKVTGNQLVLAWMLHRGWIPLITGSNREQLKENIAAEQLSLDFRNMEYINSMWKENSETKNHLA